MKTFKLSILSASALMVLAGCGGGGNNSKQPPLEGAFTGSFSNGVLLTDLVLKDGTFWSSYQTSSGEMQGFSKGHVTSDNGKFTVALTDFPKPGDNPVPANGSGVYTSTSAAGSITEAGRILSFDATAIPSKNYIYKTPASITAVVGLWSGKFLDGNEGSVDIHADGIFTGNSGECEFNGKIATTDVNVFNVSVTFGGLPCALPGETASGIGLTVLNNDGKNQLMVAVVNAAQKVGSLFYAKR